VSNCLFEEQRVAVKILDGGRNDGWATGLTPGRLFD